MSQPSTTAGATLELAASHVGGIGGQYAPSNGYGDLLFPDLSGNGNHGRIKDIDLTATSGWAGTGVTGDPYRLVLDGSGYVELPDLGATEDKVFTLEAWVVAPVSRPVPEPPANPYFFILTECGPEDTTYPEVGLCVYAPDGPTPPAYWRFFYRDKDGGNVNIIGPGGTADCCDGAIHHLVAVSDGTHGTLYVDGEAGTPVDVPAGTIAMSWTRLGCQTSAGADHFHHYQGGIIIARVYSSALSAGEIAANYAAGYLWTPSGVRPPYATKATGSAAAAAPGMQLLVGSGADAVDLIAAGLVDADDVEDSDCEHGFESCEFAIRGQRPHLRAHNSLIEGAAVKVVRDGAVTFEGEVVVIDDAGETHEAQCAGLYERAKRREDYRETFVLTDPYDQFIQTDPRTNPYTTDLTDANCVEIDTDGQLLLNIPSGSTDIKALQGAYMVLWLADGLEPDSEFGLIEMDISVGGNSSDFTFSVFTIADKWSYGGHGVLFADDYTAVAERISTDATGWGHRALCVDISVGAPAASTTADHFIQIRNLVVHVNRTTAPRVDQVIDEIATPADNTLATASDTESLGSALATFAVEPFTTRADAIEQARARYSGICDVAFWEDSTVHVRARPTAPDARHRHYCLSAADLISPDDWGIARDVEQSLDAICCRYEHVPSNWIVAKNAAVAAPVSSTGTWATDSPGWTQSHANATAQDYGSSQFYWRIRSNATNRNTNIYTSKQPCTAGDRFLARARAKVTAHPGSGNAYVTIQFRDAADAFVSNLNIKAFAAAATTEAWYEVTGAVPATATQYWARIEWFGVTGGAVDYDLCVRDFEFRPLTPAGTPKVVYSPSNPTAADARVALLDLGPATDAEAAAAAAQVYAYTNQLAVGSVKLDAQHLTERYGSAVVPTVDGALVPIWHIRAWDWITCVDAIDPDDRGPFMLSRVSREADGVTIETGGDYWQHPGFSHAVAKGRYVGARMVKRYYWAKKKVKGKTKRVRKWRWVERPGRYQ